MIRKLLEALFRHKLLLFLPPVLIPGLVTPIALKNAPTSYDTVTAIWVDHPAYLNYQDGTNVWVTPAQVQAGRLSELLHTRSFELDVAKRTTVLAPLIGTPAENRIDDTITRGVSITRPGDHIVVVAVSTPNAQLSYELCTALVDAYQEKSQTDQADQASLAISFYQSRIQDAQQQANKAAQDLRRYLAQQAASGDPNSVTDPTVAGTAALLDPKLAALQTTFQQTQTDLSTARSSLMSAQRDASAAVQGQTLGFQVLDPARMPTAPTRQLKKILVYPIAALVAALGLSSILLVLFVAADRSARDEADITPGLRLLGMVPVLNVKRVPKKLRGVATRRGLGAAAGMSLPAPRGAS